MLLASDPVLVDGIVDAIFEFVAEKTRRMLEAVQGKAQIFFFGDDFASDTSLLMGYERWQRHFKKPMARIIRQIRDAGLHAHAHCCGAVREILPDMIEMGVESIEPCQFHIATMDPQIIKREFGKHLVFFGGVDSQSVLPWGTPDEVRQEVRKRINVVGAGGGYVCASDHSLLEEVPPENILAMYEEAGSYKP